jgi:uncharacterized protein YbjQ (UPF0145 family)
MSWFSKRGGPDAEAAKARVAAAAARNAEWGAALAARDLPGFVKQRLADSGAGKTPWLSTMTPAELLLIRSHGVRPIATVCGTCWFQYGASWTKGHAEGWRTAMERLRAEAVACQANAVVDVKMRTSHGGAGSSMDYTLVGTAVRFERLAPSSQPIIATTPALEFIRLMEAGVLPTGIAVGAHYEWLTDYNGSYGGTTIWSNQPLTSLGQFWEGVRRQAHHELRRDAARQGTGVLARTQFGEIIKREVDKQPDQYLGRHIVIGTVVQTRPGDPIPHTIESVVDMRDELSPLVRPATGGRNAYQVNETEGAI